MIFKPSSGDTSRSPSTLIQEICEQDLLSMSTGRFAIPSLKLQLLNTYPQMIVLELSNVTHRLQV